MLFEFQAALVVPQIPEVCLSFADRLEHHQHYLVIQRSEERVDDVLPDVENVYIERDDQCWGGYGGIQSVLLLRNRLTLTLTPRMAITMGDHETLSVIFDVDDGMFGRIDEVLSSIFRGYEDRVSRRI